MPDFDAITVALAARFAPANVTPPTGYTNIRSSTGDLPGQMTPLPTVLVWPAGGVFEYLPSKRDSNHVFMARFYYNQSGDIERDAVGLRKWLSVLVSQIPIANLQLGGVVTSARITNYEVGVYPYAGLDYTGIELNIVTNVNEPWAAVA